MGFEVSIQRRTFLAAAAAAGAGVAASAGAASPSPGTARPGGKTILVAHGAWSAGWVWKKMHPLMAAAGHRLITPTQTGLVTAPEALAALLGSIIAKRSA